MDEYPSAASDSKTHTPQLPPPSHPALSPRPSYEGDPSSDISYIRDPQKLIVYLVPFPKPIIQGVDPASVPARFLIYTPPPPPLSKPADGQKEGKVHKVQRKWQGEVRKAKTSDAKTASWQGVKSKVTKGVSWAIGQTTSANLDFLTRVDSPTDDGNDSQEGGPNHKTVQLEEMVLVYPTSYGSDQEAIRSEFINSMLRTKTKAQRDSYIASGLLPVAAGIDILATLVWPFGGLLEIDAVWAYSSIQGAKTARNVTKRLSSSSTPSGQTDEATLKLTFISSPQAEILANYLAQKCHESNFQRFPSPPGGRVMATEVLNAIGWTATAGEKNWEDEQWETQEVKDDLEKVMAKAAKEWSKWTVAFSKNPQKALKK